MKKLEDKNLLDFYCNKYNLDNLFTNDVKAHMKLFSFDKHEYICTHTQKLEYIYFFVNGKAKIYNTLSNGKSLLLCFYKTFKILGDLELFNDKAIPCNVEVLETAHCIGIHMDYVKEYLMKDPKFLKNFCEALGEKLYKLSINSSINLLYQVENRLASYILATSEEININSQKTLTFNENLTHLAELLGTSYRHLLRTLSDLCNNNILRKNNDFYEIINIKALSALAKDLYN